MSEEYNNKTIKKYNIEETTEPFELAGQSMQTFDALQ